MINIFLVLKPMYLKILVFFIHSYKKKEAILLFFGSLCFIHMAMQKRTKLRHSKMINKHINTNTIKTPSVLFLYTYVLKKKHFLLRL